MQLTTLDGLAAAGGSMPASCARRRRAATAPAATRALLRHEPDRLPAAGRQAQREGLGGRDLARLDHDVLAVVPVVGMVAVAVHLRGVAAAGFEEIECDLERARLRVGHRAQVPVVAAALAARDGDVLADLAIEHARGLPV